MAIDLWSIYFWAALLNRFLGQPRAALGQNAANAAWEEGRRTNLEHAIAPALDADPRSSGPSPVHP